MKKLNVLLLLSHALCIKSQDSSVTERSINEFSMPSVEGDPVVSSHHAYNSDTEQLFWDKELTENSEKFSLQMLSFLALHEERNVAIAPYAVHSLLGALAEGARGKTYEQLKSVLGIVEIPRARDFYEYNIMASSRLKIQPDPHLINPRFSSELGFFDFAAIVGDQSKLAKRQFVIALEDSYEVVYIAVDAQNVTETLTSVNKKASVLLSGQIRTVLTEEHLREGKLPSLLSAAYFKGNFSQPFDTAFTTNEPFFDSEQRSIIGRVNMMTQRGSFGHFKNDIYHAIELPYETFDEKDEKVNIDCGFSLLVVLPNIESNPVDSVNYLQKQGLYSLLVELNSSREQNLSDVEVHLPRFEAETVIDLKEALLNMNVTNIFEPRIANLNGVAKENFFVSSVLHKTKISMDEYEESAVTQIYSLNASKMPTFYANRPFFYLVVDKSTRRILLAGTYKNSLAA